MGVQTTGVPSHDRTELPTTAIVRPVRESARGEPTVCVSLSSKTSPRGFRISAAGLLVPSTLGRLQAALYSRLPEEWGYSVPLGSEDSPTSSARMQYPERRMESTVAGPIPGTSSRSPRSWNEPLLVL